MRGRDFLKAVGNGLTQKGVIFVYHPNSYMTVTVAIRHEKAIQLLQDLADLDLIELLPPDATIPDELPRKKLSSYIGKIKTGQTLEQLEGQLNNLRDEWDRTI